MTTLEDDHAELENYPLSNWQPVKIISKCLIDVSVDRCEQRSATNA